MSSNQEPRIIEVPGSTKVGLVLSRVQLALVARVINDLGHKELVSKKRAMNFKCRISPEYMRAARHLCQGLKKFDPKDLF